jgi:phenylacetate-CoA ligase
MNWRELLVKPLYFKKDVDLNKYTLDNILEYSTNNVDYYKKFKDLRLDQFPFLTKDVIRNNFIDLQASDIAKRHAFKNTSGGSTGEPVVFMQDREYIQLQRYITYEQKYWAGYHFGDEMIKLWGNDAEIITGNKSYKGKFINFLKNVKFLNSYYLTPSLMKEYIYYLNNNPPKLLVSYVQSIYQLAKFIKENNIKIVPLEVIMTTAGTLYPHIKKTIEEVFGAKVYNRYGSREIGNVAATKLYNSNDMTITKGVYVEVIDEDENVVPCGVEGELVITSLINYSMPLIRYRVGDRGILGKVNNEQVLTKITGRTTDIFKTITGNFVDGEYFSDLFYYMKWVYKYQVIQKELSLVVVNIATKQPTVKEDMNYIKTNIQKVMGENCEIKFNITEDIEQLSSGKFRYTICEL